MVVKLLFLLVACGFTFAAKLDEVFSWKTIDYTWPSPAERKEAVRKGTYIPENNMPVGIERWRDKLFITVARWRLGVASSLNYVDLNSTTKSPPLTPYPDWESNILPQNGSEAADYKIISPIKVRADACDRLWVVDNAIVNSRLFAKLALLVFDLKTDKLIRRYDLKRSDYNDMTYIANVVVDVEPGNCDQAFAYVTDLVGYGLIVYSWAENDAWRVRHNYFLIDPLKGDMTVGGINFQWPDGPYGLALSKQNPDRYRTLFFHPVVSTKEFAVSTRILRNRTLATDTRNYHNFTLLGDKGDNSQSTGSDIDPNTGILFFTQVQKAGVACWNTNGPLNPQRVALIAKDEKALLLCNDVKVIDGKNLLILSNKMHQFLYEKMDPAQVNYRILSLNIQDAIRGTPCAPYIDFRDLPFLYSYST